MNSTYSKSKMLYDGNLYMHVRRSEFVQVKVDEKRREESEWIYNANLVKTNQGEP